MLQRRRKRRLLPPARDYFEASTAAATAATGSRQLSRSPARQYGLWPVKVAVAIAAVAVLAPAVAAGAFDSSRSRRAPRRSSSSLWVRSWAGCGEGDVVRCRFLRGILVAKIQPFGSASGFRVYDRENIASDLAVATGDGGRTPGG